MAIDHEAILRRAYENLAKVDETLAEPRPEPALQLPEPKRYRGFDVERFDEMLRALEMRMNKRIDELEGRFQALSQGVEGLADEAGTALGEVERKLRGELRKEVEGFRGDVALLRAQANMPARRKPNVSRAPFQLDDENASLRN